jgi:hypothetical protein
VLKRADFEQNNVKKNEKNLPKGGGGSDMSVTYANACSTV